MADSAPAGKTKVTLTGAQKTLLLTLYSKHYDNTHAPDPILSDKWATHVFDQIDFDFSTLGIRASFCAYVSLRAYWLDQWAVEFLDAHKDSPAGATVLHLACGLDARSLRLQDRYEANPKIRWVDVDVPEVADLRRKVLPDPKGDYTLLGTDVSDNTWLERVPNDRPTLVIMEGLTLYLTEEEGHKLLRSLVERFPQGGQIIFDAFSTWAIWVQNYTGPVQNTGAKLHWGIDDPRALLKLHERLKLLDEQSAIDLPGTEKYPWWARYPVYVCAYVPWVRYVVRYLRYGF
ncbi:uncharacterized protein E0L32_001326 [Thyridium curvatum]|uniref:Tetracenomycin polyketide synthesis O-methyltransferase TcmP n=1 Tax=Thyridium curvatum TaxID=1093900 RepID=A0A507AYM8_9PEZI|nr:uncharacterized protein E0L32_001326 [Thyridium curvatum]TPX10129.1 hypothetical protein E0L32_001326 [Thyridium curvatum]